jgi:hypothetical protein
VGAHDRLASMSTRGRSCAISTATPPLLVRDCQLRPNTSIASTLSGPRMPVLDWVFALCRALFLRSIFWRFVGAPVSPIAEFAHSTPRRAVARPAPCVMRNRLAAGLTAEVASSSLRTSFGRPACLRDQGACRHRHPPDVELTTGERRRSAQLSSSDTGYSGHLPSF